MHLATPRTPLVAASALLALLLTSACSDDDGGSAMPTPAPATSSAPAGTAQAGAGTYPSTDALFQALNDAGLSCTEPMGGSYEGVAEAQSCILDEMEDVVLLRFADAAERADYVENKDELANAVVGGNWAVETVLPDTAQRIADALGGEVLLGATS